MTEQARYTLSRYPGEPLTPLILRSFVYEHLDNGGRQLQATIYLTGNDDLHMYRWFRNAAYAETKLSLIERIFGTIRDEARVVIDAVKVDDDGPDMLVLKIRATGKSSQWEAMG